MFYNTYRATKAALRERTLQGTGSLESDRKRLLELQKKEKLKGLLITKFCRKYGIIHPEKYIEDEVSKFVDGSKLTDAELRKLEEKIRKLLQQQRLSNSYRTNKTEENFYNSNNSNYQNIQTETTPNININQNNINEKFHTESHSSSKTKNKKKYANIYEELAALEAEESASKPRIKKLDFTKYGNEWNAINIYNKLLYDKQKKEEAFKENEDKIVLHEALAKQIEDKEKRLEEEKKREKEYGKILRAHNRKLIEIEKEKARALEEQNQKFNQFRLMQMEDERKKRRLEELRDKKWEKEQLEKFKKESEEQKQFELEQQKKRVKTLQDQIKENEEKKKKLMEKLKKQKEEDVQLMLEMKKMDDKKEEERRLYFRNIEKRGNKDLSDIAKENLEKMKREAEEERLKYKYYTREKIKYENEKELLQQQLREERKKDLAKFLEIQIEEKRKHDDFDKILDEEQARIFRLDDEKFKKDRCRDEKIIDRMNKNNLNALKKQMEEKRIRDAKRDGMSGIEYSMNYKILEDVHNALNA